MKKRKIKWGVGGKQEKEEKKDIAMELRDWVSSSHLHLSTSRYTPSANCAINLIINLAQEHKDYIQELRLLPLRSGL